MGQPVEQVVPQLFGALSTGVDDDELVVAAGSALLDLAARGDDHILAELLAPRPGETEGLRWCVRRYATGRAAPVETIEVESPAAAVQLVAETGSGWDGADLEVRDPAGVSWRPAERRGAEFLAAPPTGAAISGDDEAAVATARTRWDDQLRRWRDATPAVPVVPVTDEPPPAPSAPGPSRAAEALVSDERLLTSFADMARRLDQVTEILERAAPDEELIESLRALARPASAVEIANEVVGALPQWVTPAQLDALFIGLPRPATEAHLHTVVVSAIENAAIDTQEKIADRLDQAKAKEVTAVREAVAAAIAAAPRVPAQVDQAQLNAALGSLQGEVAKLLAGAPQLPTADEIGELVRDAAPSAHQLERIEAVVSSLAERVDSIGVAVEAVVERQAEDRQQIYTNRDGLVAIARRLDAIIEWTKTVL